MKDHSTTPSFFVAAGSSMFAISSTFSSWSTVRGERLSTSNGPSPRKQILRSRLAGGFTLTELLVVILIIAVIATLSMMGIRQFRSAADKVVAVRNISQLQLANASYAADNAGRYMPVYTFDEDSNRASDWYSSSVFLSYLAGDGGVIKSSGNENTVPLNMLDPVVVRTKGHKYDTYDASFGYNGEGHPWGNGKGWGNPNANQSWFMSEVVAPERSCAFMTATDWLLKYGGRSLWKGEKAVEGKTPDGKIAYRHKGNKALVVYFDGHVGEITMEEIEKFDSHPNSNMRGNKNIFWNPDGK